MTRLSMNSKQLPVDWQIKPLGDVLKLEYGKPLPKDQRDDDGKFLAYGANGIKCRTNNFYWDKPSIIVGRKGSAGEVNLTLGKFWPLDVTYFVVFDEHQYDLMFLYYCLICLNLQSLAKGVKPGINRNDVYSIECGFPPRPEQKRIVAILDEAFAGITQAVTNAEKNLANSRELFESYLNSGFTQKSEGWTEKRLGELGKITSSKRIFKREYTDTGIPFYRTKEVKEKANGRDITTELFIAEERYNEIKQKFGIPQKGDILLTAIGTIGEAFVVDGQEDFYFKDGNVLWLKKFNAVNSYFLRYVLMAFVENLKRMSHGSAYNALPIEKLKNHTIHLPSSDEQLQIVSRLDAMHSVTQRLETIYQQKLTALAELKRAILQKAFTGELTADTVYQQVVNG